MLFHSYQEIVKKEKWCFLGVEIYFTFVIRAFQKHLESASDPIEYHPVNEIDDDAYINDYY